MTETPEDIAASVLMNVLALYRNKGLDAAIGGLADVLCSYGEVCAARERESIVNGLHNAAFLVRRDGGSEERAKAFEDAAFIAGAHARQ